MTQKLSLEQIRRLRLRAQRLARPASDVGQLVKALGGLQAQELPSATLAVRARSRHLIADNVKQAREVDRSIVLTWSMRGTMHLVTSEDLGWLLPLFGPLFIRKSQRRYTQLRLDPQTRQRAARLMRETLSRRGPLTRPELAETLAAKGVPVEGQAIAHLVRYAALAGEICFGPEQKGQLTYVILEDWLGSVEQPQLDLEQTQAELARRYLGAYGPASPADFAKWAGISATQARAGFKAIAAELFEAEWNNLPIWMLKRNAAWLDEPISEPPHVRLLPRYDTYLLGYQSRDFMVSKRHAKRIHPGGGLIKQALIVDGRVAGVWRSQRRNRGKNKNHATLVVEPFEALSKSIRTAIEAEGQDIGRFLQQKIDLNFER